MVSNYTMTLRSVFCIAAIGCAFTAGTADAGTGPRYGRYAPMPTRLVIHRAANFGNNISVNVYVDGALVGNVAYNRKLDVDVPAGQHVVELEQVPRFGGAWQISRQRINFAPGQAVFTVITDDGGKRAVLDRS